jgi:hypothetical protein
MVGAAGLACDDEKLGHNDPVPARCLLGVDAWRLFFGEWTIVAGLFDTERCVAAASYQRNFSRQRVRR